MIPGGPPPQHYYGPVYHQFTALPPRLAQKIRSTSTLLGSASITLSVITGLLIIVIGYQLPTAVASTTIITVGMGALSAFFQFFSAVTLTTARASVKNTHLNTTLARQASRLLVTFWGGTIPTTAIATFFFTGAVTASGHYSYGQQIDYSPPIIGYVILLGAPLLVSAINMVVGWRLLRPTSRQLRKYSSGPLNTSPHP